MFSKRLAGAALLALALCAAQARAVADAGVQAGREQSRAVRAGEVTVVLREEFFNAILEAMLTLTEPPAFPLGRAREGGGGRCASEVVLTRETQGRPTAVKFEGGRIKVPVAFRGSYEAAVLGCLKFEGWADAELTLAFDAERQVLTGRVHVRDVQLKNLPTLLTNGVTGLVQDAIDRRVNPLEILRAEQLGGRLPLARSNAALRLRASAVRHEVVQKELRLHVAYEVVRGE